jgi:hypothetical protein
MGESNGNQAGVAGQRPRETFERSRGPLFPPLGNKQLNPAHLTVRGTDDCEVNAYLAGLSQDFMLDVVQRNFVIATNETQRGSLVATKSHPHRGSRCRGFFGRSRSPNVTELERRVGLRLEVTFGESDLLGTRS